MKTGKVYSSEISRYNKFTPSYYLNYGKRTFAVLDKKGQISGVVGDIIQDLFRPGIFKRIFVRNGEHGSCYITASNMMNENPKKGAKWLSNSLTDDLEYMSLKHRYILVSCAGTIGNVRFIDKSLAEVIGSQDIIRVVPKENNAGFVYAYLCTPTVYEYLQSTTYGSVVPRIEPLSVNQIPLVNIDSTIINETNKLVETASSLRVEAADMLSEAERLLKDAANLRDLTPEDYDYFGPREAMREVSCFARRRKDITITTINAFNHSERIRRTKASMICPTKPLREVLLGGEIFSTGSFPRIEVKDGYGIKLINQKDIFDTIIKGKYISKREVKVNNMVEYGEVLVAGVGTLGESETFCRTIFANEDLVGQLVSGEFIRMKVNNEIPSGYLYAWLNSDYGFRFIRNTQAGTKLCRPIPRLFLDIPVPIISSSLMIRIDKLVKEAHAKRYEANETERKAIRIVEQEIEKWSK